MANPAIITRRSAIVGLGAAVPLIAASAMTAQAASPDERFQRHLAETLKALDEMPWPENTRWFLSAAGRQGQKGRLLELTRYDRVPDPEIPGLIIEESAEIIGY